MYELVLQINAISSKIFFPINDKQLIRIGKHSSSDILVLTPFISRFHAEVRRKQAGNKVNWYLADGDLAKNIPSTNGTFLNGKRINNKGAFLLKDGDVITLSSQEYPRIIFTSELSTDENLNGTAAHDREEINNQDPG